MTESKVLVLVLLAVLSFIIWNGFAISDLRRRVTELEMQRIVPHTGDSSVIVGCVFDNATKAGDYVMLSSTVAGNCHDAGTTKTIDFYVLGNVLQTGPAGVHLISTRDLSK